MDRDVVANTLGAAAMRLLELRLVKRIVPIQPAIGSNFVVIVPGGVTWEVLGVAFTFSTSAVVANRQFVIRYQDADGNILFGSYIGTSQPASQIVQYSFSVGLGNSVTSIALGGMLPEGSFPLSGGYRIASSIGGLDLGDQVINLNLYVREWSESDVLQELSIISQQLTSQVMPEIIS